MGLMLANMHNLMHSVKDVTIELIVDVLRFGIIQLHEPNFYRDLIFFVSCAVAVKLVLRHVHDRMSVSEKEGGL